MIEAGIDSGDLIIIKEQNSANIGDLVVALTDEDKNTLKRLCYDGEAKSFYLHPENRKLDDIYVKQLRVQGIATHVDTIDKQRLLDYIGHISTIELRHIDRALAISVGLVEKYNKPWINGLRPELRSEVSDKEPADEMFLCLCPTCASQFYNSPDHIIRRVNPLQVEKEYCTYCDVRKGYDYRIIHKKKRLGDDRI